MVQPRCPGITEDRNLKLVFHHIICSVQFLSLLIDEQTEWKVKRDCFLVQKDSYNCGPIACLKLMKVFQNDSAVADTVDVSDCRRIVMNKFIELTEKFHDQLQVDAPSQTAENSGSNDNKPNANKNTNESHFPCILCPIQENDNMMHTLECCQKNIHKECLSTWMQCNGSCLFCQKPSNDNQQKFIMGNKDDDKETDKATVVVSSRHVARLTASAKRRKQQIQQAEKMKKRRLDSLSDVTVGKVVSIKQDWRDVSHARGVLGVVFDVAASGAGGVQVATAHGIIKSGIKSGKASAYYIPSERYVMQDDDCVILEKLEAVSSAITSATYEPDKVKRITLQAAHKLSTGYEPCENKKCKCKQGICTNRCSCMISKLGCTSKCLCNGNCKNPHN